MSDTQDIIAQARFLVALDEPALDGPYGGYAAKKFVQCLREAADRLAELDRIAELLAAALLIRGVEAKDCDALDEWMRL